MNNLIYPNLFLFLYDLKESLGDDLEALQSRTEIFADKLPRKVWEELLQRDKDSEDEYLELLSSQIEPFPESDQPFEGYYYPVRLNDTYGLIIACSFPDDGNSYTCDSIEELKKKIQEKLNPKGTLGETWLFLAYLENFNDDNSIETIAKKCFQALGVDWKKELWGKGKLLGGHLFEYWNYELLSNKEEEKTTKLSIEDIRVSQHLIISLYPDRTTAKKGAGYNFDWLSLLSYRHKIFWAYSQSRYLKLMLKENFRKVEEYTKDIEKGNLNQYRKIVVLAQTMLSSYTIHLNDLGDQLRTLEINLLNYKRRLELIQKSLRKSQLELGIKSVNDLIPKEILASLKEQGIEINPENLDYSQLGGLNQIFDWWYPCNVEFLKKTNEKIDDKYLLQLKKDYENFQPGLELLKDLIESIRGITAIERAQRERIFQNTVAIFGVGLAAGSATASVVSEFPETFTNVISSNLSQIGIPVYWLEISTSVFIILGIAILAGIFTALLVAGIVFIRRNRIEP
jgi:hypothetical protein